MRVDAAAALIHSAHTHLVDQRNTIELTYGKILNVLLSSLFFSLHCWLPFTIESEPRCIGKFSTEASSSSSNFYCDLITCKRELSVAAKASCWLSFMTTIKISFSVAYREFSAHNNARSQKCAVSWTLAQMLWTHNTQERNVKEKNRSSRRNKCLPICYYLQLYSARHNLRLHIILISKSIVLLLHCKSTILCYAGVSHRCRLLCRSSSGGVGAIFVVQHYSFEV